MFKAWKSTDILFIFSSTREPNIHYLGMFIFIIPFSQQKDKFLFILENYLKLDGLRDEHVYIFLSCDPGCHSCF